MTSLSSRFLNEISELIEVINVDKDIRFNPTVLFFSSLLFTFATSFSESIRFILMMLALSLFLAIIFKVSIIKCIEMFLFLFAFIFTIYIPHLIYDGGPFIHILLFQVSKVGLVIAIQSALRTAVASLIFFVFISYMGWRNIAIALRSIKMPENLVIMLIFFMKFLPIHIRSVSRMLFARESRLIVRKTSYYWKMLASIVSDLLIKSNYISYRFYLGLKARGFDQLHLPNNINKVRLRDIFALILTISIVALGLMSVI